MRKLMLGLTAGLMTSALYAGAAAAGVAVFAEGAYREAPNSDLEVRLYANIDAATPVLSYGVALSFDSTKLAVDTASVANGATTEPNGTPQTALWFMGDGSTNYPYMTPEISTNKIVFIGGKLDTRADHQNDGVSGTRVYLGKVKFNRVGTIATPPCNGEAAYFGISLALGKVAPYDNFVTTAGTVLDGSVSFSAKIRRRGDANTDSSCQVNAVDARFVTNMASKGLYSVFADCNASNSVNATDARCITTYAQSH